VRPEIEAPEISASVTLHRGAPNIRTKGPQSQGQFSEALSAFDHSLNKAGRRSGAVESLNYWG